MATNKLNKNCRADLKFISAGNTGAKILMAQNSQIEQAYRRLVNKTLEAIRDVDSRQQ
ncbi:hypothetical protein [Synechocystis sp. PCC 7509]|uniref:hypothetical protein n=1 Tax=Synechocystis sp. PCC 7509 TaxID=927677 RepID=UPI0002AB9F8B|nr:hypothetical protein [Synechocystis sp. PCC 7509]